MISQCFHQLFLPEENNSKSVNRIIHAQVSWLALHLSLAKQKAAVDGRNRATASIMKLATVKNVFTFFVLLFKTGYDNIWSVVKNRRT